MNTATFLIKVGGDYACFTNPGLKVERCTYPVMTPAAARGVLEAIYWKPQFRWEIREIKVLKPIRQISIMRNEIEDRQDKTPIVIERNRQQRASLILKAVEYVITAEIVLKDGIKDEVKKAVSTYLAEEEVPPSALDKAANWFARKLPGN